MEELTSNEHTKFLGLELDSTLNWKEHVDMLTRKISSMVYALRITSSQVHIEAALSVYHAYIASRLSYGIIFWGNSVDVNRVFVIQKSCIRSIFKLRRRDTCRNVFKQYRILTLPGLYIYECACFAKKHYSELMVQYVTDHKYNTREWKKGSLRIPQTTSAKIYKSVVTQILRIYNHIPQRYKDLPLKSFKLNIKNILIDKCLYEAGEFLETCFY